MDVQACLEEKNSLLTLSQKALSESRRLPIEEWVYETMGCLLIPECRLPWVEEIFVPGHPYYESYCDMRSAYARIAHRLGAEEEDQDLEIVVDSLLEHGRIGAMKMFEYGRLYEREHTGR